MSVICIMLRGQNAFTLRQPFPAALANSQCVRNRDSAWDTNIRLKAFSRCDGKEIKEAHGYAYGGAIIQDMGYYRTEVFSSTT